GRDGTLAQGRVAVGDHKIRIDMLLKPEAAAFRAGTERIVERKQPRLDFRKREARDRAGEFLGEDQALGIGVAAAIGGAAARLWGRQIDDCPGARDREGTL